MVGQAILMSHKANGWTQIMSFFAILFKFLVFVFLKKSISAQF